MRDIAVGLLLGLAVGGINQGVTWWALRRTGPDRKAVVGRYLGGCAVRLLLDALTLYASWLLTRSAAGIIAAATGLWVATGAFTWRLYRSASRGGGSGGGRTTR